MLFEQSVFEQRRQRELSAEEFCERMLEAQRQTYGDGLAPDALHAYMWAVKSHYYSGELSFYNYPYMYGLLFGLGLYSQYRDDPARFRERYDDLLSRTGMEDAPALAADFGMDVRSKGFWRSSLEVLLEDIRAFEELAASAPRAH
jgi:oligoendopeptidase F